MDAQIEAVTLEELLRAIAVEQKGKPPIRRHPTHILIDAEDYYKAPHALTKKLIDAEAEELVKCERCPRRVHHEASYWYNDERTGKTLLCSFCYREAVK